MKENTLPNYEPPVVRSYTNEEILEELGPARTNLYDVSGGNYVH